MVPVSGIISPVKGISKTATSHPVSDLFFALVPACTPPLPAPGQLRSGSSWCRGGTAGGFLLVSASFPAGVCGPCRVKCGKEEGDGADGGVGRGHERQI